MRICLDVYFLGRSHPQARGTHPSIPLPTRFTQPHPNSISHIYQLFSSHLPLLCCARSCNTCTLMPPHLRHVHMGASGRSCSRSRVTSHRSSMHVHRRHNASCASETFFASAPASSVLDRSGVRCSMGDVEVEIFACVDS